MILIALLILDVLVIIVLFPRALREQRKLNDMRKKGNHED